MNKVESADSMPAGSVLMVRPALFGFNSQTSASNSFQNNPGNNADINKLALFEFDTACEKLERAGVDLLMLQSLDESAPDCIFPNNWFSTHADGRLVQYPMMAENRRRERNPEFINKIIEYCGMREIIDLSESENAGRYLEGTGSVIFDHGNRIAYAAISPRTNKELFDELCRILKYEPFSFSCMDPSGRQVYHTNVVLHIGDRYAVIYSDGIKDEMEKEKILLKLRESGKEIISINAAQVNAFCGNMLQLSDNKGGNILACSHTSYSAFSKDQLKMLERFSGLLICEIPVIEKVGGGGIRCMLAELFRTSSN